MRLLVILIFKLTIKKLISMKLSVQTKWAFFTCFSGHEDVHFIMCMTFTTAFECTKNLSDVLHYNEGRPPRKESKIIGRYFQTATIWTSNVRHTPITLINHSYTNTNLAFMPKSCICSCEIETMFFIRLHRSNRYANNFNCFYKEIK